MYPVLDHAPFALFILYAFKTCLEMQTGQEALDSFSTVSLNKIWIKERLFRYFLLHNVSKLSKYLEYLFLIVEPFR